MTQMKNELNFAHKSKTLLISKRKLLRLSPNLDPTALYHIVQSRVPSKRSPLRLLSFAIILYVTTSRVKLTLTNKKMSKPNYLSKCFISNKTFQKISYLIIFPMFDGGDISSVSSKRIHHYL